MQVRWGSRCAGVCGRACACPLSSHTAHSRPLFTLLPADWVVDGEDLVAAIRTAYGGADSFHNSNCIPIQDSIFTTKGVSLYPTDVDSIGPTKHPAQLSAH